MSLTAGQAAFISFISSWLILSFISNIIVLVVILRVKTMRNVTNIFLCNLAVSDMILASLVLPQQVHDITHADDYFEAPILCKLVNFLPIFSITGSIYSMVAIAVERYRTVATKKTLMSLKTTVKIIVVIWFSAFVVGLPTLIDYKVVSLEDHNATSVACSPTISYTFNVVNGVLILCVSWVIPQAIIFNTYRKLGLFIWRASRNAVNNDAMTFVNKNRNRMIKMLFIVVVLFAITWLPYFTILIISKVQGKADSQEYAGSKHMIQLTLAAFSCSYNFFLYIAYNTEFRKALLTLFRPKSTITPLNTVS